jgi:dTDP-4-amino-4,6-dideoxygalactose transaminase
MTPRGVKLTLGASGPRVGARESVLGDGFIGIASPDLGEAELDEVLATLQSGWMVAGPRVGVFERLLEDRLGGGYVRCLSSCSAGLLLALRCAEVGPGDEVLLPAITFAGCANVIEQLGAAPVLVDVDPRTGLIDLDHAATLVGERTRALMVVHLGGRPVDIERLNSFRERHGLAVVEDAAHAIGGAWGERPIGAHGNPTAFSFHATKNMTTIEGGALVSESEAKAERVGRLAAQGISVSAWNRHGSSSPADYDVIEPGYKLAMTDVAAAIGIHQIGRLNAAIDRRELLRRRYDDALAGLPLELEPAVEPGVRHARHLYAVRVREDAPISRDALIVGLRERGIGASVHFKGLHQLTYYSRRCRVVDEDLPAATEWSRTAVSLPLYPSLADADHDRVAQAVTDLIG